MVLVRVGAIVLLALAVPLSGIPTARQVAERCCCPDPEDCRCPGHDAPDGAPTLQACGKAVHLLVSSVGPPFILPTEIDITGAVVRADPVHPITAPHAPPDPEPPPAPS